MHHIESVAAIFERALDRILARVFVSATNPLPPLAVAYSGGLDSSVLLHLAHEFAARRGIRLLAFHIHHGLSPHADAWLAHCDSECVRMGVGFDARRVLVAVDDGRGLEAAARTARYAALGELCRAHRVPLLLTAHHQDDQAETVLLQMLRGAGMAGMSGMAEAGDAPDLLGDEQTLLARPLLDVPRTMLRDWVVVCGIAHVEDESNLDTRHPRNALRNAIWPLLQAHFPAFRECIVRSAQHAQAGQRMLDELAAQDLVACMDAGGLDVRRMRGLSRERADNLLRHWLMVNGVRMPSSAWLREARLQLFDARDDAQVCVRLEGWQLRRYRSRIMLTTIDDGAPEAASASFHWAGEASIRFVAFGGTLHFDAVDGGLDSDWLRGQSLRIEYHRGGGKLKPALNRPGAGLKKLYQERSIPAWERKRLPLVWAGEALLFAAGIGQDCRFPVAAAGISLRWERHTS
ncbi:MAG: putative tRNA(Ile)-lysidine synthase ((Ile)-lysidine synthetase) (Ile)-2-lysyl-cytidine [Burkholderiaceae bacterium]|nr:putative tRNA(Ile)-lysidine synthase ((Ile)-lysidine synthetase) (Ile)-2-lysyl-cytidine [Burkholderiaceae bacterium]